MNQFRFWRLYKLHIERPFESDWQRTDQVLQTVQDTATGLSVLPTMPPRDPHREVDPDSGTTKFIDSVTYWPASHDGSSRPKMCETRAYGIFSKFHLR